MVPSNVGNATSQTAFANLTEIFLFFLLVIHSGIGSILLGHFEFSRYKFFFILLIFCTGGGGKVTLQALIISHSN